MISRNSMSRIHLFIVYALGHALSKELPQQQVRSKQVQHPGLGLSSLSLETAAAVAYCLHLCPYPGFQNTLPSWLQVAFIALGLTFRSWVKGPSSTPFPNSLQKLCFLNTFTLCTPFSHPLTLCALSILLLLACFKIWIYIFFFPPLQIFLCLLKYFWFLMSSYLNICYGYYRKYS